MRRLAALVIGLGAVIACFVLVRERTSLPGDELHRPRIAASPSTGHLASNDEGSIPDRQSLGDDLSSLEKPTIAGQVLLPPGFASYKDLKVTQWPVSADVRGRYPTLHADTATIARYLKHTAPSASIEAQVDEAGEFALNSSHKQGAWLLGLRGWFLGLDRSVPIDWQGAAIANTPIELRAFPRGAIMGSVAGGDEHSIVALNRISLEPGYQSGLEIDRFQIARRCERDGSFAFQGLRPGKYQIAVAQQGHGLTVSNLIPVQVNQVARMDVNPALGCLVRGTVSATGKPLSPASVFTQHTSSGSNLLYPWGFLHANVRSAEDGSYAVRVPVSQGVKLLAEFAGRQVNKTLPATLQDGDELSDFDFDLGGDNWIHGTVICPDELRSGSATVSASVGRDRGPDNQNFYPKGNAIRAGPMGKFLIPCPKSSRTIRLDAVQHSSEGAVLARGHRTWAQCPESPVEIQLQATHTILGDVRGPDGEPITTGRVFLVHSGSWQESAPFTPNGSFALSGIPPGDWMIRASAQDWKSSTATVHVSETGQIERAMLVLDPDGAVEKNGTVLSPTGNPVAGATLAYVQDETWISIEQARASNPHDISDARGQFRVRSAKPLVAWAAGFAPSLPQAADGQGGEFILRLRHGGRVEGVARLQDGSPAAGAIVRLTHRDLGYQWNRVTGQAGDFALDALAPGRWLALLDQPLNPSAQTEPTTQRNRDASATFEVRVGQTTQITLGPHPGQSVRVQGRVSRSGRSVAAQVAFIPDGALPSKAMLTTTNGDGEYSLDIPSPGKHSLYVTDEIIEGSPYLATVVVPVAASWQYDVQLPAGVIEGQVQDTTGAPLAYQSVHLRSNDRSGKASLVRSKPRLATTDNDGRFRFDGLDPAEYRVAAKTPGGQQGMPLAGSPASLPVQVSVPSSQASSVILTMEDSATLQCQLNSAGDGPVQRAGLWVFDGDLLIWGQADLRVTESVLRATVPPGRYSVFVSTHDEASSKRIPVRLTQNKETRISVELSPQPSLAVSVVNMPFSTIVTLRDATGLDWSSVYPTSNPESSRVNILDFSWEWGPLPRGSYVITASNSEGSSTSATVTLSQPGELTRASLSL